MIQKELGIIIIITAIIIALMYGKMILIWRDAMLKKNEQIVQDISEYFEGLRFLINRFLIYLKHYFKLSQCSKYHFMKIKLLFLSLITIAIFSIAANSTKESEPMDKTTITSENPPYHEMPPTSEKYTNATVAARMIDGLGYRYYWATKDLREERMRCVMALKFLRTG